VSLAGPKSTPKTSLTLSAAPGLVPEDAGAAANLERELEAIDAGDLEAVDRLIQYVWPFTERDAPIITEAEYRLLDGNR
jgi:hypothetical protein